MLYWYIIGGAYLLVAIAFYIALRSEATAQDIEFSPLQVIVAAIWLVWVLWYIGLWAWERFKK